MVVHMYRVKATLPMLMPMITPTNSEQQAVYDTIWRRAMRIMGLAGEPIYEHGSSYQLTVLETVVSYKGLKKILDGWRDQGIELKVEITQEPEDNQC